MKSSLAYSILYHNALKGASSLYITAEQSPASLSDQMEDLGMDSPEARKRIFFYDAGEARDKAAEARAVERDTWATLFKGIIDFEQKAHQAQLVAFDSINLYQLLTGVQNPRLGLFQFFRNLRSRRLTTLAIAEVPADAQSYAPNQEDFMADGVIHLKFAALDDVHRQLRVAVTKMRGVKHTHDYHALTFADGQFQLLPVVAE